MEAAAYKAFETCWKVAGPPSPEFFATQEGGRLYAIIGSPSFGGSMAPGQFDKISGCMADKGVTPTWGFPPSMMGGARP